MKHPLTPGDTAKRGAALVTATIVIGSMMMLSMMFMLMSVQSNKTSTGVREDSRALYMAESALNEAAASLLVNSSGAIGSEANPVAYDEGLMWVNAEQISESEWRMTSTAMTGSGRASIEAVIQRMRRGGITRPFASNRKIDAKKGLFVDSYDSDLGTYVDQAVNFRDGEQYADLDATVLSNDKVRIGKGSWIGGDLYAGPDKEIKMKSGYTVTGELDNLEEPFLMPSVTMPPAPPSLGKLHLHGNSDDPAPDLVLGPGEYHYKEFKIHKDTEAVIVGPTVLYVDKKFEVDCSLVIDDSAGPVIIYSGKEIKVKKKAEITVASGKPQGLWAVMAHLEEYDDKGKKKKSKHKVKIEAPFTGVIYAPDGKVEFKKEAEVWGSVMANETKFKKGVRFHYDVALGRIDAIYGGENEVAERLS